MKVDKALEAMGLDVVSGDFIDHNHLVRHNSIRLRRHCWIS